MPSSPDPSAHRTRRLRLSAPYDRGHLFGFLASRAIPGVEVVRREGDAWVYARTLRIGDDQATVRVRATGRQLTVDSWGRESHLPQIDAAVRRIFDLETDAAATDAALAAHRELRPLVTTRPGLHLPGAGDPHELVVRAMVGQQISVAAASTICGRIAREYGDESPSPVDELTHVFPTAERLTDVPAEDLPMPRARARAISAACGRLADGSIDLTATDPATARAALLDTPGIGAWTAGYVLMRATQHRDVLLTGDLIIRRSAAQHGMPDDPRALAAYAQRFAPLRSYVNFHLWAAYSP